MKTIIVPTDFSDNAMHALRYASMLNTILNGKIILFHSYAIPVLTTHESYPEPLVNEEYLKKDSVYMLEKQIKNIKIEYPGMDFETFMKEGETEETIERLAKRKKADFVVMGTHGATGLREALVGSLTADVIEDIACPVIAVPEKAKLDKPSKIVFATDYALNDFENVSKATELARLFNAEIILLHVNSEKMDKTYEFAAIENFKERIKEENKYDRISFKLIENNDVLEGLNLYIDKIKADLLAMTKHHRTFLQKLFHRGLTKKMTFHTHIPLLAFHAEE